ncbi:MAG TPA: hypothetical protein RMH80_20480, partial [Polyangiaceae bacterium LLY-WYZ-15_(1-7)]|nr:hypothetical protein [Polyangiaceae bacterium LLY-WYZ-15_(1-7)]
RAGGGEGTLQYMPPEQRANAAAAPSADVYALGVSMREMLDAVEGEVPEAWYEMVAACTRKDPRARPLVSELITLLG